MMMLSTVSVECCGERRVSCAMVRLLGAVRGGHVCNNGTLFEINTAATVSHRRSHSPLELFHTLATDFTPAGSHRTLEHVYVRGLD